MVNITKQTQSHCNPVLFPYHHATSSGVASLSHCLPHNGRHCGELSDVSLYPCSPLSPTLTGSFANMYTLKNHIVWFHPGYKPSCRVCRLFNNLFRFSLTLVYQHMYTLKNRHVASHVWFHPAHKPSCRVCRLYLANFSFSLNDNLVLKTFEINRYPSN
jgi:hypothetical protein